MGGIIHATAVAWGESAILFLGPPGSGKSTKALQVIESGGRLIADDLVELNRRDNVLFAGFPKGSPIHLMGCLMLGSSELLCLPFCPYPMPVGKMIHLPKPSKFQ